MGAHSMGEHGMGGHRGMAPHISSGHGFGHEFGRFDHRHDFAFRHDGDHFRDHDFDRHDRFFDHRHHFAFHHDGDRFRDRNFDRDDRFFHRRHFFFGFDFASFGFPYPYYYDYPYDYAYYDYGPAYDYQYWNDLAVSVQSELARRGYYHGSIDGVIGAGSREAIRAFQAAQGLPVTERIDPKLLKALGVSYRSA
jgi:hypothetical protein